MDSPYRINNIDYASMSDGDKIPITLHTTPTFYPATLYRFIAKLPGLTLSYLTYLLTYQHGE
jgi:hypothetical protein